MSIRGTRARIPIKDQIVALPAAVPAAVELKENEVNEKINLKLRHGETRLPDGFSPESGAAALAKARRM